MSILIPCHNAEKYVGDAIDSALAQTHPNIEVVVVDDGSTDGSVKVLESYGERIRFEAGPNRGACHARNRALALSKGRFIQFLDADDLIEPSKVERQLPPLLADEADMVLCKVGLLWPPPRPRAAEKKPHPVPQGDPFLYFARYAIQTAAPLHRRSCLESVGGFREELRRGQEYDLHLRMGAMNPRLAMIEDVLVWVRMHDGPRITKSRQAAEHGVELYAGLAEFLILRSAATPQRSRWLAERLFFAARSAHHAGAHQAAQRGFALASQLDPDAGRHEYALVRWMRRTIGSGSVERVISATRRWRRRAKSSA